MTDEQIIRKFAGKVLRLYQDSQGLEIDGGDMHDILEQCELLYYDNVYEEDIKDGWPDEWGLKIGDGCDRYTDLARSLFKEN